MSTIIELSIFPTDKGESVSEYVARVVGIIERSGLAYQVNPMGTCIEGEWPEAWKVVDRCFTVLQQDCTGYIVPSRRTTGKTGAMACGARSNQSGRRRRGYENRGNEAARCGKVIQ